MRAPAKGPSTIHYSPAAGRPVRIAAAGAELVASFSMPAAAKGTALFVVGHGGSRRSRSCLDVLTGLQESGLATLLVELLTPAELTAPATAARVRLDVELLASRISAATAWLKSQPGLSALPCALLHDRSSSDAAALSAAAHPRAYVRAPGPRGSLDGGAAAVSPALPAGVAEARALALESQC